jgi:predicted branched-subunit amino acid permease
MLALAVRRHPEFRQGALDMLGVALGIGAWGLMTGVAIGQSGLGMVPALLMNLTVFAGSAQLAATPLILAGAPLWVVFATALCVNLRFMVFSAHMRPYLMHLPLRQRLFCGYLTGDLTYVLFVKRFAHPATDEPGRAAQVAYLIANGGVNWLTWTTSSVVGVVAANFIPMAWGLGFAGILALTGMVCSLASSRLRWVAAVAAATVGVASYALPLRLNILLAIAVAVALCLMLEKIHLRREPPASPG